MTPEQAEQAIDRRDVRIFRNGGPPREGVPLTVEGIRAGLIESGARKTLADTLARDAASDAAVWAVAAEEVGMTPTEIARLANVTRRTVYRWLRR